MHKGLLIVVFFLLSLRLMAQFSGSNMAEYQLGNIPGLEPADQSSLYNQLNLKYRHNNLSLFTQMELYQPSFGENNNYAKISQLRASYNSQNLSLEVGNNYASLGRGLLMRNYSLPSSVYEDRGYRIRYAYNKDILGLTAKYKSQYVDVKLLYGSVLDVILPPAIEGIDRRADVVEGGELTGKLGQQSIGLMAMRHTNNGVSNSYGALYYNGNVGDFSFYAEGAKNFKDKIFSFSEETSYGAYLGLNYANSFFGASAEVKKYQDFLIGNGVNDPPTLIKEHNVRLLNRSTHVPHLSDETGYQVELYFYFDNGAILTINNALAKNNIAGNEKVFKEVYADYYFSVNENIQLKVLADFSQDPLMNEPQRYSAALQADLWHYESSSLVEFAVQSVERNLVGSETFTNTYGAYTFSKAGKYTLSAIMETSSDAFILEEGQELVIYPAISASYYINHHNKITVFAGKRRGGPSCTSGVCYDVLDFEGVELRLVSRF